MSIKREGVRWRGQWSPLITLDCLDCVCVCVCSLWLAAHVAAVVVWAMVVLCKSSCWCKNSVIIDGTSSAGGRRSGAAGAQEGGTKSNHKPEIVRYITCCCRSRLQSKETNAMPKDESKSRTSSSSSRVWIHIHRVWVWEWVWVRMWVPVAVSLSLSVCVCGCARVFEVSCAYPFVGCRKKCARIRTVSCLCLAEHTKEVLLPFANNICLSFAPTLPRCPALLSSLTLIHLCIQLWLRCCTLHSTFDLWFLFIYLFLIMTKFPRTPKITFVDSELLINALVREGGVAGGSRQSSGCLCLCCCWR